MAYEKQTWIDYPDETTPISAERLNHIEQGIEDAGESAGNLRLGYESQPDYVTDEIPVSRLDLYQETGSTPEHLSVFDAPSVDTITKLKGLIDAVGNTARDNYNLLLKKQSTIYSVSAYYKDQENNEIQYQLRSGNMPAVYYSLNNYYTLPSGISQDLAPANISSPLLQYGNSYVQPSDSICYIKYQGNKIPTYLFKLYGHSTMYLAYAMYSTTEAVIIPIDTSTHEIVTNDYIGTRYADNLYSYFPFNVQYVVSGGSDPNYIKSFMFNGLNGRPVYYYDGNSYQAYSASSGYPFVYAYVDGVDFTKLDLNAIDITLHDGTNINYGYVYKDNTIACPPQNSGSAYGFYYIHNIGTDKYMLINISTSGSSGIYVYATILDTVNHTYSASPELYGGSGSSPYLSITLYLKDLNIVDDSDISYRTTYSSTKIELLLADIQAQIDAIPAEKEVVYPDTSSISTPWSVDCFTYLDSNDEYVPYTSSDDRVMSYPYFNSDNKIYEKHWTPKTLSILFGNLQITDGVVSVDTNYAYHDPTESSGINKVFSVPIPNETDKYLVLGVSTSGDFAAGYIGIIDTTNHTVTSTPPGDVWSISGLEIKYEK